MLQFTYRSILWFQHWLVHYMNKHGPNKCCSFSRSRFGDSDHVSTHGCTGDALSLNRSRFDVFLFPKQKLEIFSYYLKEKLSMLCYIVSLIGTGYANRSHRLPLPDAVPTGISHNLKVEERGIVTSSTHNF